ncbi:MAG: hypothetical protein ACJAR2_003430 [Ilumatobacter sp.]
MGSNGTVTLTWDREVDWADLGDHRFRSGRVTTVATVASLNGVFFVAEVFFHLDFQTGLNDLLGQLAQQPARANEAHPFCACLLNELHRDQSLGPLGILVFVLRRRHQNIIVCPSGRAIQLSVSGQTSSTVYPTLPVRRFVRWTHG